MLGWRMLDGATKPGPAYDLHLPLPLLTPHSMLLSFPGHIAVDVDTTTSEGWQILGP